MKIGVLTLPLNTNYGGILQAYALQTVLKRMGHKPFLLERRIKTHPAAGTKGKIISIFTKLYFRKDTLKHVISEQVDHFIHDNINLHKEKNLENYVTKIGFDAYIVGSDQVWRPIWGNKMSDYFLDFAKDNSHIVKIAYAASFAVDEWEFTPEETQLYAPLAKLFNAISVREKSGIALCKKYFNVDAVQMLDPTLLLEKSDYEELVIARNEPKSNGNMFCYILDQSDKKRQIITAMRDQLVAKTFDVNTIASSKLIQLILHKKHYQVPSVTKWLRAFMDADYVITDSFHGCVFSIIFNKPFWAIGNTERGIARFTSLFELFGLENRMITGHTDLSKFDYSLPIDWEKVNQIKKEWQTKAIDFLKTNLYHKN